MVLTCFLREVRRKATIGKGRRASIERIGAKTERVGAKIERIGTKIKRNGRNWQIAPLSRAVACANFRESSLSRTRSACAARV